MPKIEERDQVRREVLPIPDRKLVALTTYTAKDPDTKVPPNPIVAAACGRPERPRRPHRRRGVRVIERIRGACQTPNAERLAKGGLTLRSAGHTPWTRRTNSVV
jgi:arylsulfatase